MLAKYENILLSIVAVIFYAVGTVGIASNSASDFFLSLTPYHLLLSFTLLLLSFRKDLNAIVWLFVIAVIGFSLEWIGVHTHWLFGNYWYDENMGFQISEIPLVIACNWLILIVSSAAVARKITSSKIVGALLIGTIMTLLDTLIEPVAMRSGFWSWKNDIVPFYNYLCWFVASVVLGYLYLLKIKECKNIVAETLFYCILVFFVIQNCL